MTPSSTQSAANAIGQPEAGSVFSQKRDDLNYQVVTVGAILLVLATLCVF